MRFVLLLLFLLLCSLRFFFLLGLFVAPAVLQCAQVDNETLYLNYPQANAEYECLGLWRCRKVDIKTIDLKFLALT